MRPLDDASLGVSLYDASQYVAKPLWGGGGRGVWRYNVIGSSVNVSMSG